MNLHILLHADFESSKVLEAWARDHKLRTRLVHRYRGEELPPLSEVELLAVLGGPMSAYDPIPWIQEEISYLAAALESGKKVLGICLGSQLLAAALGARVYPGKTKEIGWFPLKISPEALEAFPWLPPSWKVFHWHGDTYTPPPGVRPLGMSELTPCQGFFRPPHLLALQFHPEVTEEEIRGFEQAGEHILPPEPQGEKLTSDNQALFRKMLDRWKDNIPAVVTCPLCSDLDFPLVLETPLDSKDETTEFPDHFLNLRIPDQDLLLFYRNTERRLLECPGCGKSFLYSQQPSEHKDWVKESLLPLNREGRGEELSALEAQASSQAEAYGTTYRTNLPRILKAVERLREV